MLLALVVHAQPLLLVLVVHAQPLLLVLLVHAQPSLLVHVRHLLLVLAVHVQPSLLALASLFLQSRRIEGILLEPNLMFRRLHFQLLALQILLE